MFDKTTTITLIVEGMMCEHCVARVQKALKSVKGVKKVDVNLESKKVTIDYVASKVDIATISQSIVDAGYTVKEDN